MTETVTIVARLPRGKRQRQDVATLDIESNPFEWKADQDCLVIGVRNNRGYQPLDVPRAVYKDDIFVCTLRE